MRLNILLLTAFLMSFNLSFSQSIANPDVYPPIASFNVTPASVYTIPQTNPLSGSKITSVLIRMWGAGSAGESGGAAKKKGGGGGAFITFVITDSLLKVTRDLNISSVGAGGTLSNPNGGSTVIIHNNVTFTASGGTGVNGGTVISWTLPHNPYIFKQTWGGGNGATLTGSSNGNGGGGGAARLSATGLSGSGYSGGQGVSSTFGSGGTGSSSTSQAGFFPGGGGSGSAIGASGAVYIYDYSTGALPVLLSNFTVKPTTDNKVNLAWVTASESNNKGFRIERKAEGESKFNAIGFVASKAEGGNSQLNLAYSFKDMTAPMGSNMYRLVQEDIDGKQTISDVKMVKLNGQSVVSVYPNPSNGAVTISRTNDGKKMNVQILDQSGRVINQYNNILDSNLRLNLPQSGIYQIKLMYPETGEQSIQRIVVQH